MMECAPTQQMDPKRKPAPANTSTQSVWHPYAKVLQLAKHANKGRNTQSEHNLEVAQTSLLSMRSRLKDLWPGGNQRPESYGEQ